jgi:hypothetical protein
MKGALALAALLASDPDAALWLQITKLRTRAIRLGLPPPAYVKLVPVEMPPVFKHPGRAARKRAEQQARAQQSESNK